MILNLAFHPLNIIYIEIYISEFYCILSEYFCITITLQQQYFIFLLN